LQMRQESNSLILIQTIWHCWSC